MSTPVQRQREIIDRRALSAALDALATATPEPPRTRVVELLRQALQEGRAEVRRRFEAGASGGDTVRALSFLMDQLIRALYDFVGSYVFPLANPTAGEHMAVVAVGGYGRGELAPYSDIDLLFLLPYKQTPHTEQVVEYLLYALWDLGLKVGQATRSVDEYAAPGQGRPHHPHRSARGALYLGRSAALLRPQAPLRERDHQAAAPPNSSRPSSPSATSAISAWATAATSSSPTSRRARAACAICRRCSGSPNSSIAPRASSSWSSSGVLSAEEAHRFDARRRTSSGRCAAISTILAGRAEDRLTFDRQTEVGRRMGYTDHAGTRGVERFMKHYFLIAKDVGDLTRIFCAQLEVGAGAPAALRLEALGARDGSRSRASPSMPAASTWRATSAFRDDPVNLLRLFHVAQEHGLDVHPRALRLITQSLKLIDAKLRADPEANRLFMEMLTSRKDPEIALRRLNEAGVFGRFVPDFGRVVAQMQYDMYHVYTVDEHTIFAIGILGKIEAGELKDELPLVVGDRPHHRFAPRALSRGAAARHRQGPRRRPFASSAPKIGEKLGPRLGLSAEETETVAWLVRCHLLMSNTAFKRDIDDPQTIRDFAERVQSPERLKLLLVLTVADIRAVGPKVWNGWKATLLRELYHRAIEVMSGGLVADSARPAHRRGAAGGAARCCRISARPSSSASSPRAILPIGCPSTPRPTRATRG